MKIIRKIIALALLLILSANVYAANSATEGSVLPVTYEKGVAGKVIPITVNYDTGAADLIIKSPASDAHVALIGLQYVEADAHNVTFKSGSTTLVTYQMAANSGISHSVKDGVMLFTEEGEDLIINSDVALAPFVVYVVEFKSLQLESR